MPTDHTFTGQKQDSTGLMYYRSRYYDPSLGQFISPDTIVPDATSVLSYNRFMYVAGRPLNMSDPSGHTGIERGPYLNPGSNCYRWCGGAASMDPRRPDAETLKQMENAHQQAELAAGYVYGALEMAPYADTPNDVLVATTGCGYRCQAGFEEPVGAIWRVGAAAGVILPFGFRHLQLVSNFVEKTHLHHIFPKLRGSSEASEVYRQFFKKHNINVDDFAVEVSESLHKHLHRAGNNWVTRWKQWIDANPNATTTEIYQFAGSLMDEYGINSLPIVPYE
ncbi:MAG: DUF2380 domain-containing protein [Caldilineaceae bacterium]|nr:DUF2380 domain-containing protein [Caldilineaceae bacterium]